MSQPATPFHWLERTARQDPDRVLLETPAGRRVTYSAMASLAHRIAATLEARGVVPGDRVVAQVDKSPEALALYLACLALGAAFVPLNTAYTSAELQYFLADAAPALAVGRAGDHDDFLRAAQQAGIAHLETLDSTGGGTLMEQARKCAERGTPAADDPSALAALLYTSGTTGRSKGAMLSCANLASNAATLAQVWRFTPSDVLLHALPIFHVHGLFVAVNTVLASGCSMLFLERFDAEEVLSFMPRATAMMGVPTFYTRLLKLPALTRETCAGMRLFISGSAPLLAQTHDEFRARTGHAILERYGMSETLMNTSNPYHGDRIAGSVGKPLPGVEIRLTDPQTGSEVEDARTIGMIEVRGPNVFSGYWRMPERTEAEFRADGFFITGDLGHRDERGYLYIAGRNKDLVITGGYNVYPVEVELEIDALAGVMESAVIGVSHPDFGEAVTAIVVMRPDASLTERAILSALEGRLAKYKLPKRVLFVDELPRNTMGKVQKAALRERYRDLYAS